MAKVYTPFWETLLQEMAQQSVKKNKTNFFSSISPGKKPFLSKRPGIFQLQYYFHLKSNSSRSFAQVTLDIALHESYQNEFIFDFLLSHRKEVEAKFGETLFWENKDGKASSYIINWKYPDFKLEDKSKWSIVIPKMVDAMYRLEFALREPLEQLSQKKLPNVLDKPKVYKPSSNITKAVQTPTIELSNNPNPYTKEYFDFLTQKHGSHGSWGIWNNENEADTSIIHTTYRLLHSRAVGVGLNISAKIDTWSNFHGGKHDRKLRKLFHGSKLEGLYLTDLFKGLVEPKSTNLIHFVKANPNILQKNINFFLEEMQDVQINSETLFILFGADSSYLNRIFRKYVQCYFPENGVVNFNHYSDFKITDIDWVKGMRQTINCSNYEI